MRKPKEEEVKYLTLAEITKGELYFLAAKAAGLDIASISSEQYAISLEGIVRGYVARRGSKLNEGFVEFCISNHWDIFGRFVQEFQMGFVPLADGKVLAHYGMMSIRGEDLTDAATRLYVLMKYGIHILEEEFEVSAGDRLGGLKRKVLIKKRPSNRSVLISRTDHKKS